jgi:hypothetical protein
MLVFTNIVYYTPSSSLSQSTHVSTTLSTIAPLHHCTIAPHRLPPFSHLSPTFLPPFSHLSPPFPPHFPRHFPPHFPPPFTFHQRFDQGGDSDSTQSNNGNHGSHGSHTVSAAVGGWAEGDYCEGVCPYNQRSGAVFYKTGQDVISVGFDPSKEKDRDRLSLRYARNLKCAFIISPDSVMLSNGTLRVVSKHRIRLELRRASLGSKGDTITVRGHLINGLVGGLLLYTP